MYIFSDTESFVSSLGEEREEADDDELGFTVRRAIQRIGRAETEKEKLLKEMKSRLEKDWTSRVLADSLEGSCINMEPSKIKYRLPATPDEWRKVKRTTSIETPLHFNKEAKRMI